MSIVMLHTNYCLASTRQSTLHMYSVRASNTFLSTRVRKIYLDEMQIELHKTANNWNWIQTISA